MAVGKVVSPEEWLEARKALLLKEKEFTKARDALSAERRQLPMEKVDKDYTFCGPDGKVKLVDLFEGRSQLIIQHFMFAPDQDAGCVACSFCSDNVPKHLEHLNSRDTTFAAVSRAPFSKIKAFKERLGWTFPYYSSFESSFNYDYQVTNDSDVAPVMSNYRNKEELQKAGMDWASKGEQPGVSVFYRDADNTVYHTYSTYARGVDALLATYNYLDLTPLGRQDKGSVGFEYHDQY